MPPIKNLKQYESSETVYHTERSVDIALEKSAEIPVWNTEIFPGL